MPWNGGLQPFLRRSATLGARHWASWKQRKRRETGRMFCAAQTPGRRVEPAVLVVVVVVVRGTWTDPRCGLERGMLAPVMAAYAAVAALARPCSPCRDNAVGRQSTSWTGCLSRGPRLHNSLLKYSVDGLRRRCTSQTDYLSQHLIAPIESRTRSQNFKVVVL